MGRVQLASGRIIETNDEVMRLPYDNETKYLDELIAPILNIDKESDEWKGFSQGWDATAADVDRERHGKRAKRRVR